MKTIRITYTQTNYATIQFEDHSHRAIDVPVILYVDQAVAKDFKCNPQSLTTLLEAM